jgi:hypothetical protein
MIFAITLTLCSSNSSIMCGHISRKTPRAAKLQDGAIHSVLSALK